MGKEPSLRAAQPHCWLGLQREGRLCLASAAQGTLPPATGSPGDPQDFEGVQPMPHPGTFCIRWPQICVIFEFREVTVAGVSLGMLELSPRPP